nr:hypothetical protein [Tanacetum cinerariifolium]
MGDTIAQTRSENVANFSNYLPLSKVNTLEIWEDRLKLKELIELCTKLSDRVLNLETTKTAQAKEIANLKKRVTRLERKRKSRSHGLKRLYKVGLSARVESSADEESLGEEDASKQERISDIDANQEIYLVNIHRDEDIFGVNDPDDASMFDTDKDLQGKEVVVDVEEMNAASIATSITATTPTISMDEITLAKLLIEMKTSRPKAKGIVMQKPKPEMLLKKKAQISLDEDLAFKLQAKEDEQERIVREKAQQIEEVNLAWDDIQAKVDADYELAERLQAEEQEQLTDDEKAKLFMEFMGKRRKALKNKSFADIQDLFNKAMKRVNMFVDIDTEVVESTKKFKAKTVQESSSKRVGDELEQESSKKQKIEAENESVELKRCLEIVPDDGDEVTIDATPLSTKSSTIVDYKIYKKGRKSFF